MIGREQYLEQNTDAWHEARRRCVTASEISTLLRNPKRYARDYIRKVLGMPATFGGNEATNWGHEAEPLAARWFSDHYDVPARHVGFVVDHHDNRLGCSPDRLVIEDENEVLLEIKCPHSGKIPEEPNPEHVEQVQFQMGVTGIHRAYLLYWTPDAALGDPKAAKVFPLDFDKAWWHQVIEKVAEFFGTLPPKETWLDWLQSSEPLAEVRRDYAWQEAAQAWVRAKRDADAASAAEEEARAALLALSPEKPAEGGGVRLSWIERQGNVNWKAVQKEFAIPDFEVAKFRGKASRYAKLEVASDDRDDRKA